MAEFVMKDLVQKQGLKNHFIIASAGTSREELGSDTHPQTKAILRRNGVPYQSRSAVQITKEDLVEYDYIIVMDDQNRRNIERQFSDSNQSNVYKLMQFAGENADVADPWYTNNYEITYHDILKGCICLLSEINKTGNPR